MNHLFASFNSVNHLSRRSDRTLKKFPPYINAPWGRTRTGGTFLESYLNPARANEAATESVSVHTGIFAVEPLLKMFAHI